MRNDLYCINCNKLTTCKKYPNKNPLLMYCEEHSSISKRPYGQLRGIAKQKHEARLLKESLVEDGINKGEI